MSSRSSHTPIQRDTAPLLLFRAMVCDTAHPSSHSVGLGSHALAQFRSTPGGPTDLDLIAPKRTCPGAARERVKKKRAKALANAKTDKLVLKYTNEIARTYWTRKGSTACWVLNKDTSTLKFCLNFCFDYVSEHWDEDNMLDNLETTLYSTYHSTTEEFRWQLALQAHGWVSQMIQDGVPRSVFKKGSARFLKKPVIR